MIRGPVTMSIRNLMGASALAIAWTIAGAAAAQDEPETQVEDIVVTAQLREQRAVDVPFALTAFSGETLEDLGVQEFDQLSNFTPGFVVQNQSPNNPGFVMRGITSDSGESTVEPRVSVYQDGVSISKSRGSYVELFDLARVEVAKGPQSTLYGRGALIGAVNLVQNKARLGVNEAEAGFEVGDLNYRAFTGFWNAPLSETLALRFAGRFKTRNGYVDNLLTGEDFNSIATNALRLSARYQPAGSSLTIDLIGNYQQDTASGTSFKAIAYSPANPDTGAVLGGRAPWEGAAFTRFAQFDGGKELGLDRQVWGVTNIVRWDISDAWALTATGAYRKFDSYEAFDPDGISLPLLQAAEAAEGQQISQDVRLNFDNGGRVSGFIGGGVFRERGSQRAPTQFDERIALAQLAGVLDGNPTGVGTTFLPQATYASAAFLTPVLAGLGIPAAARPGIAANLKPVHLEEATNRSELTSYDIFGDLTFALTDRLEVAAGVRYTRDDKTTGFSSRVLNGRSVLGGLLAVQQLNAQIAALVAQGTPAALTQAAALGAQANAIVTALATPGVVNFPATALPLFGLTAQPTQNNGDFIYRDLEDEGVTWRLTARYALSDDVSLYANYGRGRRPEVLSARAPSAPLANPNFTQVAAEEVDSYEVGAKSILMDGALRLDGAVYHYTYDNFQTTIQDGTRFIVTNAGEASATGFEGQVFWSPAASLDLFANYGFNDAQFDNGIYKGNRFRLSPEHKAAIGATVRLPVFGGGLEIQPSYTWQSEIFFNDDNDIPALQTTNFVPDTVQDEKQEAYGLLNLRVRYEPSDARWTLTAFADNLLDEEYIKDAGNTGDALGLPTFIAGRSRTVGLGFTARY